MKSVLKWILIVGGALVVLVIAALLVVPMFVDVQKYKPEVEKRVSEATGRSFAIGGDLKLSLFPWAGLAFSDLHLGNPDGFQEKDLVSVKSFDVQVKLLPLVFKDIQVKHFTMEGPRIVLERSKEGRGGWEGIGKPEVEAPSKEEKAPEEKPVEEIPIKGLVVGNFSIKNGSILYIDHAKNERREISGLDVKLEDVSLDRPIRVHVSARVDGRPLSLEGQVGPVGKEPGKGALPLDVSLKALGQLDVQVKGKLVDAATTPQFDLALQVAPFSPRKLVGGLGQDFPLTTSDPKALDRMAVNAKIKGSTQAISLQNGALDLDDSKLTFSVEAKDFAKPDLQFALNLDQLDADRYLPPPSKEEPQKEAPTPGAPKKKTDYTPLRTLVMDGEIKAGKLKVKGAQMQDLYLKVTAKNGVIKLEPATLKLYDGDLSAKGIVDVSKDVPKTNFELKTDGVNVRPAINDVMAKDFLEGKMKVQMAVSLEGDEPERIKRSLNGNGEMRFNDGAIVGIDLAGMVRNAKAAFGLGERGGEKPRTDFSEFAAPFTIKNGVVNTLNTQLLSPLLRVTATGDANLVDETLDFRVEPKAVGTIKGQGDTMGRSGIMVPVLVTGSFASPKFAPDLKGILTKGFTGEGVPKAEDLKGMIEGKEKVQPDEIKDKAKDLIKGLPFKK